VAGLGLSPDRMVSNFRRYRSNLSADQGPKRFQVLHAAALWIAVMAYRGDLATVQVWSFSVGPRIIRGFKKIAARLQGAWSA
jgi:hypothetical protein